MLMYGILLFGSHRDLHGAVNLPPLRHEWQSPFAGRKGKTDGQGQARNNPAWSASLTPRALPCILRAVRMLTTRSQREYSMRADQEVFEDSGFKLPDNCQFKFLHRSGHRGTFPFRDARAADTATGSLT